MRIRLYIPCILLLLHTAMAKAQHGINSVYSAYGIGDLETRDYSRNYGLGSSGIGRRSSGYLNELNPASYSALPMQNFMFDISLKAQQVNYSGANISQNAGDIDFARLAAGFKVKKWWGIGAGITPFSTIDYKILNNQFGTGTGNPVTATTTGSGGLNRAYISNGFQLNKHFSAGVSTAFLFGPLKTAQSLGSDSLSTQHNGYTFKPNFTAGAQYATRLTKDWQLGIGATYRFQTTMKIRNTLDIVNQDQTSYYSKPQDPSYFTLPAQYGAGISLSNGTITWVADYRHELWNGLNNKGLNYSYADGERYSTGIEYALTQNYYNRAYEGAIFQLGFSYNKSPLVIKGLRTDDIAGSLGVSLPNRGGQLRYYLGVEGGRRGSNAGGLVKETYVNAVFNFSLRDIWFMKRLAQ
ncbi:hypothetical protein ECE50_026640 [Chitinophaga sp. Mgbs1]|uniref:Uncharacterized protein n=1 Tax=Chitinophaga solisilvae TaxID=1233460 RepID=A0A433WCQ7_9BACT|nr:hypothetical protein [Chitinophaga solisilvae]